MTIKQQQSIQQRLNKKNTVVEINAIGVPLGVCLHVACGTYCLMNTYSYLVFFWTAAQHDENVYRCREKCRIMRVVAWGMSIVAPTEADTHTYYLIPWYCIYAPELSTYTSIQPGSGE